jgi:hypothetical protein
MPTSTYLQLVLNTAMISVFTYPPPTIAKHPFWNFPDADLFLMIRGVVYGIHRFHFRNSTFFRDILTRNDPAIDTPRGLTIQFPIPFDDLAPSTLFNLLHHLYYPGLFTGTEQEWKELRRLSLDWELPHVAGIAMIKILEMREKELPPTMRRLLERVNVLRVYRLIERERQQSSRIHEIQIEDDDEEDWDSSSDESV